MALNRVQGPGAQVIPLMVSVIASSAFVGSLFLPWFGLWPHGTDPIPQYRAVFPGPVPPASPSALTPGTWKWGDLLLACGLLITALALITLTTSVRGRNHEFGGSDFLFWSLALASLALIPLVIMEMMATVPFGDQPLGFDWGAIVGLTASVLASVGAWFALATNRYRWLWGP